MIPSIHVTNVRAHDRFSKYREVAQLALYQLAQITANVTLVLLVHATIVRPVTLHVLIYPRLVSLGRITGYVPCAASGVEKALFLYKRVTHTDEITRELHDHFRHFRTGFANSLRRPLSFLPLHDCLPLCKGTPRRIHCAWGHCRGVGGRSRKITLRISGGTQPPRLTAASPSQWPLA